MAETKPTGKVVMMTGAARGMGKEMSIGLAAAGARLVMIDLDGDVLQAAAREVEAAGGQGAALAVVCDVSSRSAAADVFAKALDRYGRVGRLGQ